MNKKIIIFGIFLISVLFLSACEQGTVGARVGSNPCVSCIDSGKAYCTVEAESGQCAIADYDAGIGLGTFSSECSSFGGQLIQAKEQCPGYIAPVVNFCQAKTDGVYCKDINTRVECYDENEMQKPCASGQTCSDGICATQQVTKNISNSSSIVQPSNITYTKNISNSSNVVQPAEKYNFTGTVTKGNSSLKGVSVVAVSSDGTKCSVSYLGNVYTITKGTKKQMTDGTVVGVINTFVSGLVNGTDACDLGINPSYNNSIVQPISTNVTNITSNYRNALWTCQNGTSVYKVDNSSCKNANTWNNMANTTCLNSCLNGKCGIKTFSVSNSC